MMKKDPNEEVECWKDAFYERIKDLSKEKLTDYLEKTTDKILRKYGIKTTRAIKSSLLKRLE